MNSSVYSVAPDDRGSERPALAAAKPLLSRTQIMVVALAHGWEFYDFSVFGFFAVPIGKTFFPSANPWSSLLLALLSYGLGFVARPLGALVFGSYADRHGRKPAMLWTVSLMAASTLTMGLMPGYASLGLLSPVLLVVARLLQGLALGGEIGPSSTYLLETAQPHRRARALSWQYTLNGAAVLAAGLIGEGLSLILPGAVLVTWGWRIALLAGVGIVPVGILIRRNLPAATVAVTPVPRTSGLRAVLANPVHFLSAILVIGSGTVVFSIGSFLTSFALTALHMRSSLAFMSPAALGVATMAFAPVGGRCADRYGRRNTLLASRLGLAIVALPLFAWLAADRIGLALLIVSGVLAALSTLGAAAGLCLIIEGMPERSRALGLALAYTLGISLFGSTTQVLAAALIAWTGDRLSPAFILIGASLAGAMAAFGLPEAKSDRMTP